MIDIGDYFKRSGDERIESAENTLVLDQDTFVSYNVTKDAVEIVQAYGNGELIEEVICRVAKQKSLKKIRFQTRRNPKAFQRKYKCDIIGYILEREVT